MGSCRLCGMTWEAAWLKARPFVDDPSIDTCAWCQLLRAAWRGKNIPVIQYWSNRFVSVARAQSLGEVIDIERIS